MGDRQMHMVAKAITNTDAHSQVLTAAKNSEDAQTRAEMLAIADTIRRTPADLSFTDDRQPMEAETAVAALISEFATLWMSNKQEFTDPGERWQALCSPDALSIWINGCPETFFAEYRRLKNLT